MSRPSIVVVGDAEPVFQRFATGVTECLQAWLAGQALVRVVTEAA